MFYKTHISLRPGAFTDPPARFGDNWKHSDNTWNIPSESFPPDEPPSRWIESIFADVVSRCAFCSVAGWLTRKLNSWPWRSPCTQTTLLWCYFMLESVSQRYIWYIYKVYTYVCTPVQMYSKRSEWTRISCRLAVHPVCKNVSICLRIAVSTLVSNFNKWLCFLRRVEDEWFLIGQLIRHSSFTPSDQLVSRFQIHIVFDKTEISFGSILCWLYISETSTPAECNHCSDGLNLDLDLELESQRLKWLVCVQFNVFSLVFSRVSV